MWPVSTAASAPSDSAGRHARSADGSFSAGTVATTTDPTAAIVAGATAAGPPAVPAIPLSPDRAPDASDSSVGALVRDATTHLSTLVRSEVELARTEITAEVRKGVKGSIFFVIALAVLVFSLFFAFFTLAEVLDTWVPRWSAFAIVFVLMLLIAGVFGLLGYLRVRSIRKPERTITSVKESAAAVRPGQH